jgi:hypothetical protein
MARKKAENAEFDDLAALDEDEFDIIARWQGDERKLFPS